MVKIDKQHEKFIKQFREENTPEYKLFKKVSNEDSILTNYLRKIHFPNFEKVLDVGGREGNISAALFPPKNITIVDPDPTLKPKHKEIKLVSSFVENFSLEKYGVIISSHVWGDFGRVGNQTEIFARLVNALLPNGKLILCYNKNDGLMDELLKFSNKELEDIRHDYFDENLFNKNDVRVETFDFACELKYGSFFDLAKCCWVLFGTGEQDIESVAKTFEPFLIKKLKNPSFILNERVAIASKK